MRLGIIVPAALLSWLLVSGPASAYNPLPVELLGRMESVWRKIKPVEVKLELSSAADLGGEVIIRVPAEGEPLSRTSPPDRDGLVPYASLVAGGDSLGSTLSSLLEPDARTSMARLDSAVCYLLDGKKQRLWLRKADLAPLRIEVLLGDGTWAATSYRGLVLLEDRLPYPAETVYEWNGETTVVERLLNAPAPAPQ